MAGAFNKNQAPIAHIKTCDDLSRLLEVPLRTLTMFAFSKRDYYRHFSIPKKNGSPRYIDAPAGNLKYIQRALADELSKVYVPQKCTHGFITGRSIATNANSHVGKGALLNIDLTDFFTSITAARVHGLFSHSPFVFENELINMLTSLVTTKGHLPQGSPTSPVISNMICKRMDARLTNYCSTAHLFYTRYADDIVISAKSKRTINRAYDSSTESLSSQIIKIINDEGFSVNANKIHIAYRGNRRSVNGVVVNKRCNYPRSEYRSMRVMFHIWKTQGWSAAAQAYLAHEERDRDNNRESLRQAINESGEASFIQHIKGRLDYYTMIDSQNKAHSPSLTKLWKSFHDQTGERIPYADPEDVVYKIDGSYDIEPNSEKETVFASSGTSFITSNGMLITCNHCLEEKGCVPKNRNEMLFEIHGLKQEILVDDFESYDQFDFAYNFHPDYLSGLPGLVLDFEYLPQIGESVRALGYADADDEIHKVTAVVTGYKCNKEIVIVDRAFIKGMSGGPVLNNVGQVIGYIVEGSDASSYERDGAFFLFRALKDTDFREECSL